jgi:hypothetical protein
VLENIVLVSFSTIYSTVKQVGYHALEDINRIFNRAQQKVAFQQQILI